MEGKLRRIITGNNEEGKSIIAYDGPPIGFGGLSEMWVTDRSPADNKHKNDAAKREFRLEPPPNGSLLRFFQINPGKNSGMHKTKTVDYIILLEGEITLLLEDDEVDLKPFDVVIQRGTNHDWVNKGSNPALLVAVMIDAEPV